MSELQPAAGPCATRQWRAPAAACAAGALLLAAVVAAASIVRGGSPALIVSDGKAYYAWARSILIDGDVDFANDYRLIYPPDPLPPESARHTPGGRVLNKTSIGMAILEAPGVLAGGLAARLLSFPADGVSLPYQVAVCGSLALLAVAAWLLLYGAMLRLGTDPPGAFLLWAGMMGATNLVHYVAKEPAMTHAAGMALAALAVVAIVRRTDHEPALPVARAAAAGALLGLLVIVRSANLALLPFFAALLAARRAATRRTLVVMALGAAATLVLQAAATRALWGEFGYRLYPGETFTRNWRGILLGLFSARHGLFVHHPWYALLVAANAAALFLPSRRRLVAAGALLSWAALAVGNGLWWCWWFGDGFGNRAFVEALVPLTVGAAVAWGDRLASRRARVALAAALAACALANAYLWGGYLLQRYAHDGSDSVGRVYGWALGPGR